MTKNEVIKIIGVITIAYPNFDKFRDEKYIAATVNLWADIFAEDDKDIMGLAVKKHIATSKWPPSIAEIRDIVTCITNPDIISTDEAWTAVANLLYANGEFFHGDLDRSLPKQIADVVRTIGYSTLYQLYRNHNGLDRVAFRDMYEAALKRQKEKAMLPASLRQKIEKVEGAFLTGEREKLAIPAQAAQEKRDFYDNLGRRQMERLLADTNDKRLALEG